MMDKENTYKNSKDQLPKDFNDFLDNAGIPYKKSKEDIWNEMSLNIGSGSYKTTKVVKMSYTKYLVAASITLLVVAFGFIRFYTKTYQCEEGEHLSFALPDDSKIQLNAGSSVKYNPLWWKFSRNVKLEGEAFFEVEKGDKFSVISKKGITTVLGTSFNIYARGDEYEVTCVTGSVKVKSATSNDEKTIMPKEMAILKTNGQLHIKTNIDTRENTAWKDKELVFTATPLDRILEEIGRQYNINIKIDANVPDHIATFNTLIDNNADNTLTSLCEAHGLTFIKKGNREYIIKKK